MIRRDDNLARLNVEPPLAFGFYADCLLADPDNLRHFLAIRHVWSSWCAIAHGLGCPPHEALAMFKGAGDHLECAERLLAWRKRYPFGKEPDQPVKVN